MSSFDQTTKNKPTKQEIVSQLEEIEIGLRLNLANLHRQLLTLNSKPELRSSLENFKRDVEAKASDLELDVKRLREDVKSIKELLGLNLKKQNT